MNPFPHAIFVQFSQSSQTVQQILHSMLATYTVLALETKVNNGPVNQLDWDHSTRLGSFDLYLISSPSIIHTFVVINAHILTSSFYLFIVQ